MQQKQNNALFQYLYTLILGTPASTGYVQEVFPIVVFLKFMSYLGGFPLYFDHDGLIPLGVTVKKSKVALALSLFVLLVPGMIILTLLLTLSLRWTDFTVTADAVGFTFWDIFGLVSTS